MQRKVFLFSFLLINFLLTSSFAQHPENLIDSTYSQVDSLVDIHALVNNEYVYPDPNRRSHYIDSLMDRLTIKNGDFISGIDFYNELMDEKIGNVDQVSSKFFRPIWILVLVFGLFLLLGLVRIIFPVNFSIIAQAFYKDRVLLQISKEENMTNSWSYIILYLIFSAALSLFILITEVGFTNFHLLNPITYLKIAGIVTVLFILKILIIRFIAFVFLINRIVREYIAVIYLIYFNSLFVLMPFLLAVIFIAEEYFQILLIIFSIIISIMFVYRFVRTAFKFVGNSKFSIFYLFLYLCSLEVAPILILVKTLSN